MCGTSSGPVPTLPGSLHWLDAGDMCDEHPTVPAVRCVQGETDSFGCEYLKMCDNCYEKYKGEVATQRTGSCDWCDKTATDLRDRRDMDEGFSGPVYRVCGQCVSEENNRLEAESSEYLTYCWED